ncbi:uncharacterized protein LOC126320398 [Schistocerca gregaria]|uniref:uncharacterized protein LOC126320398 n=1 Tax=Schistocerca gregaria TaxID=7010 RepID=UPI00211E8F28|nr:uncharacterized protein LOC126320398 [Schistocerca gregaria]
MGDKGMISINEILKGKTKSTSWAQDDENEEVVEEKVTRTAKTWNTIEKVEAVSIKEQHAAGLSESDVRNEPYRVRDVIHSRTDQTNSGNQNSSRYAATDGYQSHGAPREDSDRQRPFPPRSSYEHRPYYGDGPYQRPREDDHSHSGDGASWRGGSGYRSSYHSPPKYRHQYSSQSSYPPPSRGYGGGGHREFSSYHRAPLPTSPPWKAFVGKLPPHVRKEDLLELFRDLPVRSVSLIKSSSNQTNYPYYAYVEFDDLPSLENALKYDNTELLGSVIHVSVATGKAGGSSYFSNYNSFSSGGKYSSQHRPFSTEPKPAPDERKPLILEPRTTPLSSDNSRPDVMSKASSNRDRIFGSALPADKDYYDVQGSRSQLEEKQPFSSEKPSSAYHQEPYSMDEPTINNGTSSTNKSKNSKKTPNTASSQTTESNHETQQHKQPSRRKNAAGMASVSSASASSTKQTITTNNLFTILEELT